MTFPVDYVQYNLGVHSGKNGILTRQKSKSEDKHGNGLLPKDNRRCIDSSYFAKNICVMLCKSLDILCNVVYNLLIRGNLMNPRSTAIKDLNDSGYQFKRNGGKHDIYYNPETKYAIPLKRGHFDEDDLRYIRKEIRQGGK